MKGKPAYFEPIRLKAARRWEQLEQDPELAGPWHQLFKQVQSPRHILSELLQNADDAGATEASVRIENQVFVFEHNGEEFTEEHFASLCRFGYSNKRALHTIGFRGIGFKSTFSLGDCVELFTPVLAISFDRKRFTEPRWLSDESDMSGKTRIRVGISDEHRQKEVEKNLEEWLKSPVSLLFFKNIRRMQIGDRSVRWASLGPGPIPESEWMSLCEKKDEVFLLLRSEVEALPEEALIEIKQERMLGIDEHTDFPPCRVEIVLKAKGRLFVVLPTGVETELPFACNAPFIQDPARMKIKDPETSPTNRHLLMRAGQLAGSAMLNWLGQSEMSVAKRAAAYGLFPERPREDNSLEGLCCTIVVNAFAEVIKCRPLLLTDQGELTREKESVIILKEVVDIWPAEQAAALLDEKGRPALCLNVETDDRKKLLLWGVVEEIDKQRFLVTLRSKRLPTPSTWRQLLNLWAYIAPEVTGYLRHVSARDIQIVPVQGSDILYAASEVVRMGEKRLLQAEEDWEFLVKYLIVLDPNWPRFLAEQRRTAADQNDESARKTLGAADAVLKEMGLDNASHVDKVINQVAAQFFVQMSSGLQGSIQLAQISAKLGVTAGNSFCYMARDGLLRSTETSILFDEDGSLEELLTVQQQATQLLHAEYTAKFSSCSQEEWLKWVSSGRAGLVTFIPFVQKSVYLNPKRRDQSPRERVDQEARDRGLIAELSYPYKGQQFVVEDWDFDEANWNHWKALASEDDLLWTKVAKRIVTQRDVYWNRAKSAKLVQVATNGNVQSMTSEALLPTWVLRLKDLPCLPDTRGFHRRPADLLRRTTKTEALIDVEPFVDGLLDTQATRPLLDLLGVRCTPTGPDRLIGCLRALARAETPPIHEVEKWYRHLDQMVATCSTPDFQKIKQAFRSEKLVLTHDGAWAAASAVFLSSNEEDAPGAAVVRSSVSDLTLWRKIGLADRPTAELAIQWLKGLPSGQVLSPEDARRVRALIVRYPVRIWEECLHWLNLAGEWARTEGLSYGLTMQSLFPWRHLHQWVKQKTADLQRLPGDTTRNSPFSHLPALAGHIEERFHENPLLAAGPEKKEWLTTFGTELQRAELDTEDDTQNIRAIAATLANTKWYATPRIEIIPYIDGTPAGTPRNPDVLWLGQALYVGPLSRAKLARRVPEEIGQGFSRDDINAALAYSFERSPEDVREYLEENFKLAPYASIPETPSAGAGAEVDGETEEPSPEPDSETHDQAWVPNRVGDGTHEGVATDAMAERPGDNARGRAGSVAGTLVRPYPAANPDAPSIVERFAMAKGFRKESDDRFRHEDGSWMARAKGSSFPWERRTATGDLVRYYWPKDHCLERAPLELHADIWGLIDQLPGTYALILSDMKGDAIEITGARLRAMRDNREVTLYPAAYRLVYENGRQAF